ncbi:FUSC family protein [Streptomyces sp. HF10]|uniref:FUSC family protein n=1 Tax=Streptomyces sp. HF10 TaxID=2692233 RepID=UPI00191676E2|nr:aromatic acid exporter family protein [Streptomyces sp. HF10]
MRNGRSEHAVRRAIRAARLDLSAAAGSLRRACAGPGRERDLTAQALKAALAAWLTWMIAGWWLHTPVAFVAPWVAVVLVESTVYRSLAHGLQQLGALTAGTVTATAVGLVLHSTAVAMAVVLPLGLLLGHWRRLGNQGIYAATGALFVLTDGAVTVTTSAFRIAAALFGAGVGIAVNALVRPPLYLRDTRAVLRDATEETHDILHAVADGLASGRWDAEEAGTWHERALRLHRRVDEARASVEWSRESLRGNMRRRGAVPAPGKGYDDALAVLDYAAVHTAGVTRTVLEVTAEDRAVPRPHPELALSYARFLCRTARALRLYSHSRFDAAHEDELRAEVTGLRDNLDTLRQELARSTTDHPDDVATYGTLLAQANRLADQLLASTA